MFGKKERTMIFMARSTKSYEERLLQLEKREQESLEKAKQYAAQKRELKKRQKDVETKKRTRILLIKKRRLAIISLNLPRQEILNIIRIHFTT